MKGMCGSVGEEIERLSIPPDGAAIAAAVAVRDQLEAKIAEAVGAFDSASLWDLDGATSMTAWLRHHAGMTSRDAARTAARSRRLRDLPATAEAWQSGQLGTGQVDAIVAALRPNTLELFAQQEAALVPSLAGLSVTDTTRAMAAWSAHASALVDEDEPGQAERALHLSKTLDDSWALDATLDPEGGAVVSTALRLGDSPDGRGRGLPHPRPAPGRRPGRRVPVLLGPGPAGVTGPI